jgi:hypothetical protein
MPGRQAYHCGEKELRLHFGRLPWDQQSGSGIHTISPELCRDDRSRRDSLYVWNEQINTIEPEDLKKYFESWYNIGPGIIRYRWSQDGEVDIRSLKEPMEQLKQQLEELKEELKELRKSED